MTIDIKSIPESGIDIDFCKEYSISQCNDSCLLVIAALKGRLYPVETGRYELNGRLVVNGHFNCDKCLGDISASYSKAVEEVFTLHDMDDSWKICESFIEIDDAVVANIYSLLPMKMLCKDDCKGLCPFCGTNLNEECCGCEKPLDSRFDLLSSFFKGEEV